MTREDVGRLLVSLSEAERLAEWADDEVMSSRSAARAEAATALAELRPAVEALPREALLDVLEGGDPAAQGEAAVRLLARTGDGDPLLVRLALHENPAVRGAALWRGVRSRLPWTEQAATELLLRGGAIDRTAWAVLAEVSIEAARAQLGRLVAALERSPPFDERRWLRERIAAVDVAAALTCAREIPAESSLELDGLVSLAMRAGDPALAQEVRDTYVLHLARRIEGSWVDSAPYEIARWLAGRPTAAQAATLARALATRPHQAPWVAGDSSAGGMIVKAVAAIAREGGDGLRWWAFLPGFGRTSDATRTLRVLTSLGRDADPWVRLVAFAAAREMGESGRAVWSRAAADPDASVRERYAAFEASRGPRR